MLAISLLTIGLAVAAPQGVGGRGSVSQSSSDAQVVEISARLIQANGRSAAGASKTGSQDFDGYLWADTECGLASSSTVPGNAVGWKFSTNIVQRQDGSLTLHVVWQRVGDQSSGSFQRTMRLGDRAQIDRVNLGGSRGCASAIQLEASVLRPAASADLAGAAPGGRGAGVGRATRPMNPDPAQRQIDADRAARARADAAAAAAAAGAARPQAGGRGGVASGAARGGRGAAEPTYTAQVWLVHTVPNHTDTTPTMPMRGGRGLSSSFTRNLSGRSTPPPSEAGPGEHEEVTSQVVRFAASGAGFAMEPVAIETTRGQSSVIVMGTLSARVENGVPTKLVVTLTRQAMGSDQSAEGTGRSSTKEMAWPQPGEVISFELPPSVRDSTEKLSIRIRLNNTGMRGIGTRMR